MATLTIRNLDDNIRDFLRQQAARHGRSMEAEVRSILETTVAQQQMRPGHIARKIHKKFADIGGVDELPHPKPEPLPDPVQFAE
ncbi:MAG: DNA-binding protein [Robiginitomaculum sp.]|nr:DNA-binding protein [Robiginitomaculum sp.]